MKVALLVAAASVLVLAGCTSMFAPDHTATPSASPAAACTADNVRYSFSNAKALPLSLLLASYQSYDSKHEETTGGSLEPDLTVALEPQSVYTVLGGSIADWRATAVARAESSGLVNDGFNNVQYLLDDSPFSVSDPKKGTYVRGVVSGQTSLEYTAKCPDGTVFSGTLTAFDSTRSTEQTIYCEDEHATKNATEEVIHAECAYASRS